VGALCVWLAAGASAQQGPSVIDAAVSAPVTVVGRIGAPRVLDRHGRAARIEVEQGLRGPHGPGAQLRIAWEALSEEAPLRFGVGERVLVVLEPAPDWSLWRDRLGDGAFLVIAQRGQAWLADPAAPSVAALARYLALAPAERGSEPGASALADLVAVAQRGLAVAALDRLAAQEAGGEAAQARLRRALLDPKRPLELRLRILELRAPQLRPLRPAIDALAEGGPLELAALDAIARLDGALPAARVAELLGRPDVRARELALRRGGAALSLEELDGFARHDGAPAVRRAAVLALAARSDPAVLDALGRALFDPDRSVRAEAAVVLGGRGAEAVPLLLRLALERGAPEAGGPVVALGLAGPAGREALVRIMATHEDEDVRTLAALALGQPLPEP
jgi:HEAT repeat protein